jgi:hypothetical protein
VFSASDLLHYFQISLLPRCRKAQPKVWKIQYERGIDFNLSESPFGVVEWPDVESQCISPISIHSLLWEMGFAWMYEFKIGFEKIGENI